MALCIVDYLHDSLSPEVLPDTQNMVIVCNESCIIPLNLSLKYMSTSDLDRIIRGGSYLVKVVNEVQRGLVYSILFNKSPKIQIFSSRPEIIAKYWPSCEIRQLSSVQSVQPFQSSPFIPPTSSKFVPNPTSEPYSKPKPSRTEPEPFDVIYKESLSKYVETILSQPIRAPKEKSAKNQLKNIVTGMIASVKKKTNISMNVDINDLVETIFNDLIAHEIITQNFGNLEYSDENLEAYFGSQKTKLFIPGSKAEKVSRPFTTKEEGRPRPENFESVICDIITIVLDDTRLIHCDNVGELVHLCKTVLKSYSETQQRIPDSQTGLIITGVIKYLISNYFTCSADLDEVSKNPTNFFGTKIIKR